MPGETKNIVDALRRALQGPAAALAAGLPPNVSLTVSVSPSTIQAPGGVANSYQSTVDVAATGGFTGAVNLTETDTFNALGTVGFSNATVNIVQSTDGITQLNVNITPSTASGTYTITVTGTSGSLTASATVIVIVGTGSSKCVNNVDCPSAGDVCSGGNCYAPVDGTIVHSGPCVSRDTSLCQAQTGTGACTGVDGNCHCIDLSANCQKQDCSAKGPCSSGTLLNNCMCGCSDCNNMANPISITCPTVITGCIDNSSPGASSLQGQITVKNNDSTNFYNVGMSIVPVGQNCAACGAGPSLSNSAYTINQSGSQTTFITIPLTATTSQSYNWGLSIYVANWRGQIVQTLSCPVTLNAITTSCFTLNVACNGTYPTLCSGYGVSGILWTGNCVPTFASAPAWNYSVTDHNGHTGGATVTCSPAGQCSGGTLACGCTGSAGPSPSFTPYTSCNGSTTIQATDGITTQTITVSCAMSFCGGC